MRYSRVSGIRMRWNEGTGTKIFQNCKEIQVGSIKILIMLYLVPLQIVAINLRLLATAS
jgi:hypothetical protein